MAEKEVVVDQKPKPQLPYDPESIPPAVRKRVAAVEALYNTTALTPPKVNGSDGQAITAAPSVTPESSQSPLPSETASATPQVSVPPDSPQTPAPAPAEPSPASTPPPPVEDENSQTWKARAIGYQGRWEATKKALAETQEQMVQLGNELLQTQQHMRARPVQPPQPPAPPPSYLTEQDVQNYGGELLDVTQRAALQVVAPHLQRLEDENAVLRAQLAKGDRRTLDQMVEAAVPNYREIDQDPRWHRWLLGIDFYTGRVRQELLNDAITAASAPRVISFFRGFLQEEVATGHIEPSPGVQQAAPPREPAVQLASLAAPGRARPTGGSDGSPSPEKPIYTRQNLRELYAAHRKGAYAGREAEWNRIDADIIKAGTEGRIIGN